MRKNKLYAPTVVTSYVKHTKYIVSLRYGKRLISFNVVQHWSNITNELTKVLNEIKTTPIINAKQTATDFKQAVDNLILLYKNDFNTAHYNNFMNNHKFNGTKVKPQTVLMFDERKRFLCEWRSVTAASKGMNITSASICGACQGANITTAKKYWRYLYPEIKCTFDELKQMTLEEYDDICGLERTYYPTSSITRKGMKYKKKPIIRNEKADTRKARLKKEREERQMNGVFYSIRI